MNKAHYGVTARYTGYHADADKKAAREKLKADNLILKNAGVKTQTYFQFNVMDKAGKAAAKIKADKEAARIEALTGVKMDVHEGCFL